MKSHATLYDHAVSVACSAVRSPYKFQDEHFLPAQAVCSSRCRPVTRAYPS